MSTISGNLEFTMQGTSAWAAEDRVLGLWEFGIDEDLHAANQPYMKHENGVDLWPDLPFFGEEAASAILALAATYTDSSVANRMKLDVSGSVQTKPRRHIITGTTSGATVTFNLTTDNTPTGPAIFSSVHKASAQIWIDDVNIDLRWGGYTLAGDLKTLTFTVKQRTFTGIVLLSTNILGSTQLVNLSNGTTLYLSVDGNEA